MKGGTEEGNVKFIALLSLICRHYRWAHDFWRRMGLREFWAWVDQLNTEMDAQQRASTSWDASNNDAGWQAMRAKRERARGR